VEWFFERAFVRKVQCMFGWDWGPRLVSCGIWQPVRLIEYASRITDVWFRWKDLGDEIEIWAETEQEGQGDFTFHLDLGDATAMWNGEERLRIPRESVPFWSSATPVTCKLFATLSSGEVVHDVRSVTTGFASARLVRELDAWGESFEFELNGEKVWARGANWIPDSSFPASITPAQMEAKVELARVLNHNMLRVWGGGMVESDAFYEACCEAGIMIWQDFPFACSYYPDDEAAQSVIAREAEVAIKRVRNYPCLALWCGNNENHQMAEQKWGNPAHHPPRYHGKVIYDEVLANAVAKFDPARSYIASSPIGESPQAQAQPGWNGSNANGYGDQHNWDVWHGRGDWRFYSESEGRFSSEYGFASSCALSTWDKVNSHPSKSANYRDPVYRWHDKTGKGYETYVGYVELHYPASRNLEEWVYYSQLNQRDALRHGVEHYRRSEFCRGSLIWQFNDIWPVQSWAYLDSESNPKPLAYELERLYSDVLISLVRKNELIEVFACNDGPSEVVDQVRVGAYHLETGEILRDTVLMYQLGANSRAKIGKISIHGLSVPDTLVYAESNEAASTCRLLAEPKNARFAPPAPITVGRAPEPGLIVIEVQQPTMDLVLTVDGSTRPFHSNVLTAPTAGYLYALTDADPNLISARSLAGVHPIVVTRSPLG
jgi:beta-mannosidase